MRAERTRTPGRANRLPIGFGALPLLVAGLAASLLALAMLPVSPAAANACRRLKEVKSFHGHLTFGVNIDVSGADPDSGGMEDISLGERAGGVDLKLKSEGPPSHGLFRFAGPASGGSVSVHDTFENTGTDVSGDATYDKPLPKKFGGGADLAIDRKKCRYLFSGGFNVKPAFSGDQDVNPGRVGGIADTGVDHVAGA